VVSHAYASATLHALHLTPYTLHCPRPQDVRPFVDYFDMAVVAPGVAAAVLMLLAACCSLRSRGWPCCPCGPCKRRRFVIPKCCICLGGVFLLLGIALYGAFAAVGLSVVFPAIGITFTAQYALRSLLGLALCDTAVPQLRQVLADAAQAVANAESVGSVAQSDIDTHRADLSAATADLASFDGICDAFKDIEGAATTLFGVGFLCVCALFYALVANTGLCCALKCCWNPARTRRVAPADVNAGAMMQPMAPPPLEPALAGAPAPGVPPTGLCCALKCCWKTARTRRVAPADVNAGAMMQPMAPPPLEPALAGAPAPGVPPHASGIPPPGVKGAWTE